MKNIVRVLIGRG